MTIVVLFILAVLWAWFLASWLRNRQALRRRTNSIGEFAKHLHALGQAQPLSAPSLHVVDDEHRMISVSSRVIDLRDPMVRPPEVHGVLGGTPVTLDDARRRRRDVLTVLSLVALACSAPLALAGTMSWLAVAGWSLVGLYGFLVFRAQRLTLVEDHTVTYLHAVPSHPSFGDAWYDEDAGYDDEWADYGYESAYAR